MKHPTSQRRMSRFVFGIATAALVMSACASDPSPSSDGATIDTVSSESSAPRQRNTMVGGFGTDGSGFVDLPLVGASSSKKHSLTLSRNGDGSSNVVFVDRGTDEGAPFNTLVQARLLGNGTFDTTFGEGGFVKFELGDFSLNKILFDSQGNFLLWMQTYVEIPNSGAAPEDNNWKEVNEIRAYTFGGTTPNANYGDEGVIALDQVAPEGVTEIVVGKRGTTADALTFLRYGGETTEIVSITSQGQIDTSVANGGVNAIPAGQHDNWNALLADTSLVSRNDNKYVAAVAGPYRGPDLADCPEYEYCPGPTLGLDYSLLTMNGTPMQGTTNDVDDLLDMGEGSIREVFLASGGVSNSSNVVSAQSTEMKMEEELPELIVTTHNYQASSIARGVFDTATSQWTAVNHFSFFDELADESNISLGLPTVAPTGSALVAFYDDYTDGASGLMACNSTFGICDVATSSRLKYAQTRTSWPQLTDARVDTQGNIHSLVTGLTIADTQTDVVVDLATDGNLTSAQTEQMPSSLRFDSAVNGNTWTPKRYPIVKLGANSTIYTNGDMTADVFGERRSVSAVGTITKTQTGRSVSQEQFVSPRVDGLGINWETQLEFDAAGNEYVPAWKNNIYGLVRLLPGTKALDTSYGVGGFAQVDEAPVDDSVCLWTDYEVADGGQVIVMHSEGERLSNDNCDWNGRRISDVAALTPNGALDPAMKTRGTFASLNINPNAGVVFSPMTQEIYVTTSVWASDESGEETYQVSIRRFSVAGTLDTSFGMAGVVSYDGGSPLNTIAPVVADNEGRLIFAGINDTEATIDVRLARLKRDGTLDAAVDVPPPPAPTPGEQRNMREEQQAATVPAPQLVQEPTTVLITGSKALGDGDIEVSWISGTVTTNATFTVTASPGGKTCTSTTTSCVVKGLNAWEKYTFTVSRAGEATQSSASAETQPVRMVKVGSRVSVKKLLTPGSKGAAKYAVSGGCKLSKSTTLIAPKKAGTCLLSVKTAKVGKTAATTRSVRIQVVTALPK